MYLSPVSRLLSHLLSLDCITSLVSFLPYPVSRLLSHVSWLTCLPSTVPNYHELCTRINYMYLELNISWSRQSPSLSSNLGLFQIITANFRKLRHSHAHNWNANFHLQYNAVGHNKSGANSMLRKIWLKKWRGGSKKVKHSASSANYNKWHAHSTV